MFRVAAGGTLLMFALFALSSVSAPAMQKGGKPPPPPIVKWDWTVSDENDKEIEHGSFTVKGYEIQKNGRRIGTYDDVSENQVKLSISAGRLKGKFELTKDKSSDKNWNGELTSESGQKYKIAVVWVKDKRK